MKTTSRLHPGMFNHTDPAEYPLNVKAPLQGAFGPTAGAEGAFWGHWERFHVDMVGDLCESGDLLG